MYMLGVIYANEFKIMTTYTNADRSVVMYVNTFCNGIKSDEIRNLSY